MKRVLAGFLLCLFLLAVAQTAWARAAYEQGALFPVRQNGKWGYINARGDLIINPQYDDAWEVSEGLAYVRAGTKRGLIDRSGSMVIDLHQLAFAGNFSEGLAIVQTSG